MPHAPPRGAALGVLLLALAGCVAEPARAPVAGGPTSAPATAPAERVEVPPPPFSEGIFPCSQCHEGMTPNRTRRVLTEHLGIKLHHDEQHRWCLDCHDAKDRDRLHLASGELIPFAESYRLCGQCHGDKLRDWRAGVHGRRTGAWNGHQRYLLCAHCHNPHEPRFKPLAPQPAPRRPVPGRAVPRRADGEPHRHGARHGHA